MAIFGPKPWVNPFGKMSIFRLFELLLFIGQRGIFWFQNIVKDIFLVYIAPKKTVGKMAIFACFYFRQYSPGKCLLRYSRTKKTSFQAIKTRSSKSRKIDIFPKGLTHGFGPKMAIFPTYFFQAILARKMSFTIFQNEKTPLQAIKIRSLKSRKIDIFPKGLTHGFGPKMAIFPTCFFQAIWARKMSFTIFQN